jgi:hypothetical protein
MPRIDSATKFLMMTVAVIFYLLELIPIVGSFVDFCASIVFGMWFSHYEYSIITKRPLGFLGTILGGFFPIIDAIPFWPFFVATTISKVNASAV